MEDNENVGKYKGLTQEMLEDFMVDLQAESFNKVFEISVEWLEKFIREMESDDVIGYLNIKDYQGLISRVLTSMYE